MDKKLTIETLPTPANLSKCHPQQQSLLFRLPAELRNDIWTYVTVPHYDETGTYTGDSHTVRKAETDYSPGVAGKFITFTDLLLTCRRIWLEANHLPMRQARHIFWNRGTKHVYTGSFFYDKATAFADFLSNLTPSNRTNLTEMVIFVDATWVQDSLPRQLKPLLGDAGVFPKVLTLGINRLPYGSWRYDRPLIPLANVPWLRELLSWPAPRRLQTIRLVVECHDDRLEEMRPIIKAVRTRFGRVVRCDNFGHPGRWVLQKSPPEEVFGASSNPWLQQATAYGRMEKGTCRVFTLVWRLERMDGGRVDDTGIDVVEEKMRLVDVTDPALPVLSVDSPSIVQPVSSAERSSEVWEDHGSLLTFEP